MSSAIYTQSLRPVISEIYCHTSHLWTCEEFHCHYWSGTHNTRMHTHTHCIRLPKETRRFMIDPMVCGFTVLSSFIIQIKYGLPYCVTCPSMSRDPGSLNPGTRRSRVDITYGKVYEFTLTHTYEYRSIRNDKVQLVSTKYDKSKANWFQIRSYKIIPLIAIPSYGHALMSR